MHLKPISQVMLSNSITSLKLEIYTFKIIATSPRVQWVNLTSAPPHTILSCPLSLSYSIHTIYCSIGSFVDHFTKIPQIFQHFVFKLHSVSLKYNQFITTKFGTCTDSIAVGACANFCDDQNPYHPSYIKYNFENIKLGFWHGSPPWCHGLPVTMHCLLGDTSSCPWHIVSSGHSWYSFYISL